MSDRDYQAGWKQSRDWARSDVMPYPYPVNDYQHGWNAGLAEADTRDNPPDAAPERATDKLTGIPVATALFDSLDGRDMFVMTLAARDLIVTEMADVEDGLFHVAYLMQPVPAPECGLARCTLVPVTTEDGNYSPEFLAAMRDKN